MTELERAGEKGMVSRMIGDDGGKRQKGKPNRFIDRQLFVIKCEYRDVKQVGKQLRENELQLQLHRTGAAGTA